MDVYGPWKPAIRDKEGQPECALKTQKLLKAENAAWVLRGDIGRGRQTPATFFALGAAFRAEPETCPLPPLKKAEMETGTPWKQTN